MVGEKSFQFSAAVWNHPDGLRTVYFEAPGYVWTDEIGGLPGSIADLPLGAELTIRVVGKDYNRKERL